MTAKIPKPEYPPTYEELAERYELLRWIIYEGLGKELQPLPGPGAVERIERFESDRELRESAAEDLLASILWVEAERPSQEILQHCDSEIKDQLVYISNIFLDFLRLRAAVQKEVLAGLGNYATAWIHLFVEFLEDLRKNDGVRWWKHTLRKYSS